MSILELRRQQSLPAAEAFQQYSKGANMGVRLHVRRPFVRLPHIPEKYHRTIYGIIGWTVLAAFLVWLAV